MPHFDVLGAVGVDPVGVSAAGHPLAAAITDVPAPYNPPSIGCSLMQSVYPLFWRQHVSASMLNDGSDVAPLWKEVALYKRSSYLDGKEG
jgi:hypothetical protein